MLDAGAPADVLDDADRSLDRTRWVVLQAERESEEEERLGVGGAFDERIERGIHGEGEVTLDTRKLPDHSVVHPQPAPVPERVAVRLLHRRSGRRADVS